MMGMSFNARTVLTANVTLVVFFKCFPFSDTVLAIISVERRTAPSNRNETMRTSQNYIYYIV